VTVTVSWEIEEGVEVELHVDVDVDGSPGQLGGHPDRRVPAWTEIDILDIANAKGCSLPANVCGKLRASNRFVQEVHDAVERQIR
jgi:hypothetical protein